MLLNDDFDFDVSVASDVAIDVAKRALPGKLMQWSPCPEVRTLTNENGRYIMKLNDKGIFKTVKTVYERENPVLSEEQGLRKLEDSTVVFLEIGVIIMQLRPKKRHFMESTKWLQTWLSPSDLYINEIFSLDGFHWNTYSLSHI